jgi:uncharacterized sulfatase
LLRSTSITRALSRRILEGLLAIVALTLIAALGLGAWVYWRSWRYVQRDDEGRVAGKEAYLAEVAATGLRGAPNPPNVILILYDDLGYGDIGAYGARLIRTPELDRLAESGVRLTDYYAPAPVCTPSRVGLLTGRYPVKTRLTQVAMTPGGSTAVPFTRFPLFELQRAAGVATRLPLEEITLAEVLQRAGYATAIFGKWHLGSVPPSLPNDRGFDSFQGVLSSNDQIPNPFYHDRRIVEEHPIDQSTLTQRYTEGALRFIEEHRAEPFFLYMPHTFPHRPLHASEQQRGKSPGGRYGDVVEDLDRSLGRIVVALERWGLVERTLIAVTSDNGPWFQGSPGGHRGRKTDLFDGGFKVPFIASWPGTLPVGETRHQIAMGIDLFPTVLALAGIPLPRDRIIDGRDILAMLRDDAPSPHDTLFFYWDRNLGSVRAGRYKYHIRRPILAGYGLAPVTLQFAQGPWLFDVREDPDESYDLSLRHPEVREGLAALLESQLRADAENPRGFR